MRITLILFLFSAILLVQCRSGKTITKAIAPRDTSQTFQTKSGRDSLLLIENAKEKLQNARHDFKTFSAKIKLDIDDAKSKKPDLLANVRMIKDSVIWISVSASILNVEVFRVYINKDSVILLNKQDKEVQYRSLDYLQEITDIPFDFKTLQYLPIDNSERIKKIKELEAASIKQNSTKVFIETPFRNNALTEALLRSCNETTLLCIAENLTAVDESIKTKSISEWKKNIPELHKKPVIFLLYAGV